MLVRALLLGSLVFAAGDPRAPAPSRRPPLPRLVYEGGRFLRHPSVVTITFAGDDRAAVERIEAFGPVITHGAWWTIATKGLCASPDDCVGAGGPATSVRLDQAPRSEASLDAIGKILTEGLARGAIPAPGSETVLVAYLPLQRAGGCAFGTARARHGSLLYSGRSGAAIQPFAVVSRCADEAETLASAAHEVLEMATDPELTGFHLAGADNPFALFGRKAIDPCTLVTLDTHRAVVDGHVFHRVWSNDEAAAGHDPCVPSARAPYFGAVPETPAIRLDDESPHARVTFRTFTDAAVGTWNVSAVELAAVGGEARCLDFALSRERVSDGTSFQLDVTLRNPACPHPLSIGLVSTQGSGRHVWPLMVLR